MTKKLVLGSVLGAIVLFVWSALAWMLIPWPGDPLRSFTNEDAVQQAITANAPASGNYVLPNEVKHASGMTDEQYKKASADAMSRMMQGPMIFASVRLGPMRSMGTLMFIQFLTQLVVALIATCLLLHTSGLSYGKRVGFITAIGVLIFLGGKAADWIWLGFSSAYMCMQLGAIVIGWFLAGLVIAKVVGGKTA